MGCSIQQNRSDLFCQHNVFEMLVVCFSSSLLVVNIPFFDHTTIYSSILLVFMVNSTRCWTVSKEGLLELKRKKGKENMLEGRRWGIN